MSRPAAPRTRRADRLALPPVLAVVPPTARFAFSRQKPSSEPLPRRLGEVRAWFRAVSLVASRSQLHPCAERLARHLCWHADRRGRITDITAVLGSYSLRQAVSVRTAWADLARLVRSGWVAPTQAPANAGPAASQGPGTGRCARYVLCVPDAIATELADRRRPLHSSPCSTREEPSPSVSTHHQQSSRSSPRWGWSPHSPPTAAERRDASALLAGCHPAWRHQRPEPGLLDRSEWEALLPLLTTAQRTRPDVDLTELLCDRVRSARSLAAVCAWRLRRLLDEINPGPTPPPVASPAPPAAPAADPASRDRYIAQARAAITAVRARSP